jgi:hypothetical protein
VYPSEWSAANTAAEVEEALGPNGSIRLLLDRFAWADDGRELVKAWNGTAREHWTRPQEDPICALLLGAPEGERARWAAMGGGAWEGQSCGEGEGGRNGSRQIDPRNTAGGGQAHAESIALP